MILGDAPTDAITGGLFTNTPSRTNTMSACPYIVVVVAVVGIAFPLA
jgi:hypothetical protein